MCQKRQRRCDEVRGLRDEAPWEWCTADSYDAVRIAWGRLGGLVTAHRYGCEHYRLLALHRHGDPEALGLLRARMVRRREAARR
jgi:hypothetical protein